MRRLVLRGGVGQVGIHLPFEDLKKFLRGKVQVATGEQLQLQLPRFLPKGNLIIKNVVYWDTEHVCNEYYWVKDEYALQLIVPPWLLERYPEETFFDLKVVNVSLLDLPPRVKLNGTTLSFDVPPIIESDRTLVPLRAIFEALGASVSWSEETQTVTAVKNNTTLSLQIGSDTLTKNNEPIPLDVPARLINNRTMIPARAISEALGATVDWDEETNTVIITSE